MTFEQLQRAIAVNPFVPFVICMADGQRIPITHPEAISLGGNPARTCVTMAPDGKYRIIDLLLATILEFEASADSTGGEHD